VFGMNQADICWECEGRTETSFTVTLRTSVRQLGTLTLCPACYLTCYRVLVRDGSRTVDVSLAAAPGLGHRDPP
jgi:hypothetical protein